MNERMLIDALDAQHRTHYEESHLWWLRELSTIVGSGTWMTAEIIGRLSVLYQSSGSSQSVIKVSTPVAAFARDVLDLYMYYISRQPARGRFIVHQVVDRVSRHLGMVIVEVTTPGTALGERELNLLKAAYQRRTGSIPLIVQATDPHLLAGFTLITHPMHQQTWRIDGSLQGRFRIVATEVSRALHTDGVPYS